LQNASVFRLRVPGSGNRIELLDFMRGTGMLLVLLHHSDLPGNLSHWILSFHMPYLFLLSGYTLYLRPPAGPFRTFLCSRFLRLIVPYFLFEGLNLFVWSASLYLQGGWQDVTDAAAAILACLNTEGYTGYYGRLWFWPCMFISDLLFYCIHRLSPRKQIAQRIYLPVMIAAMLLLSWITCRRLPFRLPFTADTAFMATVFLLAGYLLGPRITWLIQKTHLLADIGLLLLSLAAMFWSVPRCGGSLMMFINQYGHYGYSVCAAFSGTLCFLLFSKWLYGVLAGRDSLKSIVLWYGYNSLATFPVHLSVKMWIYQTFPLSFRQWYILLPAMFLLNIPIVNVITRFFPFMLGKLPYIQKKKSSV